MELNRIVFPSTKPTYSHELMYGQLIYIPCDHTQWSLTEPYISSQKIENIYNQQKRLITCGAYKGKCIPCLYQPYSNPSSKILIYFHGNAEDVFLTKELVLMMKKMLKFHVIVMEYEGYGVYEGKTTSEGILHDAELVYQYVNNVMKFDSKDIILFGRSIGSGPATYLASKHPIHSLILMSAFISLRAVAKNLVGSVLQYIIADRFNNKEYLKNVCCPVFIIHGKMDNIVPYTQAEELMNV